MNENCDVLFLNGTVITMDDERRIIQNGAVAVRGNRIVAVDTAEALKDWTAERRIDCRGQAVIPGLIDCHNHLFQVAGRGLGDGMALWQWLGEFMLPLAAHITPRESLTAVRLAAMEALSSGTTTVIDNHYAPADIETTLAVASALRDIGIRGVVARGMFGPFTDVARDNKLSPVLFKNETADEIASMRACLEQWKDDRIAIWPSPINVIYNDQDLVVKSVELASEFGVKWHTHCSEAEVDPLIYEKAYGERPFVWMQKQGLLGSHATFAHAIWLDDEEVEIVGGLQCGLAHNPMSNQYLSSGAMRLKQVRQAGATVGLGADGAAGHSMDLFQIMKQAIYVQRLATLDPESSNAWDAFELATREGARLAGVDAGQLTVGKLADVVVVSLAAPAMAPCFDLISNLVYAGSGRDVRMTMVDGRVVYESGDLTLASGEQIIDDANQACLGLIKRLGIPVRGRPDLVQPSSKDMGEPVV